MSASPYRFAVVTHLPSIQQIMRRFMGNPDVTLDFFSFSYQHPVAAARQLLDQGYEVILYYSSLGPSILSELGHSIIIIQKTDVDIIKALVAARKVSRNITLTVSKDENVDVAFLENLLDIHITSIPYDSLGTLSEGLYAALARGLDVLVGGGLSSDLATQHSLPFVRVEPNLHSISLAIAQAKAMAEAQRVERESLDQLVAVLRLFREGVLCINEHGKTVFSNVKALELLRINPEARGDDRFRSLHQSLLISDVLADGEPREDVIVSVRGQQLLVTTLPISVPSGLQGAVAFISDVNAIQNMAGQIRESQHRAGFVAHFHVEDIQGETPDMIRLKRMARLYAPHGASVWIHGETGTGKELLAQSLHNASPRARYPFVAINCAALPESLLESELFGYAEGAFTGAKRGGKPGVFEMAHKGTLFLDEVGDMGLDTQSKLLRILETKELVRVGGNRVIPVDIRVLSASHKPLADLVREKSFRPDLFYRLAALRLRVPPLRQRLQDLPLLLGELLRRYGRSLKDLTPAMLDALRAYPWPGNIRELLAFMESYLIVSAGQAADQSLFLELFRSWCSGEDACGAASCVGGPVSSESGLEEDLKDQLNRARLDIARRMLDRCGGNRRLAASRLGISYNTLWRILENGAPE